MADIATPAGADVEGLMAEIAQLQNELALERAKNEVLLEQVLKAEDSLAEKDVETYSDVIPNEDRDFWRGQLLENRDSAVGILNRMRNRAKPDDGKPIVSPSLPKPLHNRETAKPAVANAGGEDRAAKLRNRAQEIARKDGCSFTVAFRAAEQELGEVR
jgi:hypothetical protein